MSDTAAPWLVVRNLVAGYRPGIDILRGVSVEATRGQVRCVLGPNGTGKSTLLKVLFGFLPAREGEIRLDGHPLRSVGPHEMGRHGVVYLPQRPSIFPYLTVEVNLRLGAWRYRGERGRVEELGLDLRHQYVERVDVGGLVLGVGDVVAMRVPRNVHGRIRVPDDARAAPHAPPLNSKAQRASRKIFAAPTASQPQPMPASKMRLPPRFISIRTARRSL